MLNNKIFKLAPYVVFICSIGISASAIAEYIPDYTCPEASQVKAAIIAAIDQNQDEVKIPARFGLLQADLTTTDISDVDGLAFKYATFLFGDVNAATFEVACAYKTPDIVFYKNSNNGQYTLYTGASPNWIPDADQLYATCTYSARYCVFMKKPV